MKPWRRATVAVGTKLHVLIPLFERVKNLSKLEYSPRNVVHLKNVSVVKREN